MARATALCALLLALVAAATAAADIPVPRDAVSDLLDSIRQVIREGDAELGIPVLDPFQLAFLNGSLVKDGSYAVEGELRNVQATGLAGLDGSLSWGLSGLTSLRISLAVSVPQLLATSGYGFSGTVKVRGQNVDLYGDGPLEVDVQDISLKAEVVISIITFTVRSVDTSIDIGDIELVVDGLLEGGLVNQLVSAVASELAGELFEEQKPVLEEELNHVIEDALADYSLRDVLCLVIGVGCSDNAWLEAVSAAAKHNDHQ